MFSGKLKSKWSGPFEVVRMTNRDTVEPWNEGKKFTFIIVNGQRV